MIVDWGTVSYREKVRPFRNSDREVEIIWYPVPDTNPVLDVPSFTFNQINLADQGDVTNFPKALDNDFVKVFQKRKPFAVGQHRCGDAIDFAEGGLYLPDEPPPVFRPDGLPLCCGAAFEGVGGGMGGGVGEVSVVPLQPTPGTTCAAAPTIALDVVYSYPMTVAFEDHWFKLPMPPGPQAHIVPAFTWPASGVFFELRVGSVCPGTAWGPGAGSPCFTFATTADPWLWVHFICATPPTSYSFKIGNGPCPP